MNPYTVSHLMRERARKIAIVALIGSTLGLLFFSYLHYSETARLPSLTKTGSTQLLASVGIGALISVILYFFNHQLDRWLPWARHFVTRFLIGYLSNLALSLLIGIGLAFLLMKGSGESFVPNNDPREAEEMLMKITILMLSTMFIYNVVYALLYSYQHYALAQIENIQAERKQLELQFEALKGQISPHYLFNSLNTISSLVYKDTPSAEQFIRRLAQTYQYILATQHKRYVLLEEEIDFVQSYYYLLRIRFQQQLNVEINVPSGIMRSKIPPLTLQILVENAVKHNALNNDQKLFIYITAQDNTYLRVINTKTGSTDRANSFKMGLENIKQRYRYFTDKNIEVRDEDKFTVSLPVILSRQDHIEQKNSA